ncbi:HNH endonuclease, partial [Streptococcus pneumoniae]|uniref:HNH endonuclease n=1 Tax=Streptococcus pneumoniae TaxID=1313 RepID=UPI0039B6F1DF
MMEALGLEKLPENLVVHHIDGDAKNNELDNLALLTREGHVAVHYLQSKDSL